MTVPQAVGRLVAVAPDDPLARRTFSGLSANLFGELQWQGIAIDPIATKDLRWHDALRGAVRWQALPKAASRVTSRIRPNWFWSRQTNELMTHRFLEKLEARGEISQVLQIGTHVQAAGRGRRVFCLTDLTVVQAIETGGMYQVAQASARVQDEAVAWQHEVFDGCERIFVLSDWTARSVVEHYHQSPAKVLTVGVGANVPRVLPPRAPDPSAPAILFVGLDWEQKGGPLVLEAFRRVRQTIPRARLVVVGCRPHHVEAESGVDVLGRLDRALPTEENRLLHEYATATCFCIAPAVDAFPNVLLEAAAFGLPVVSTDEGSRSEAVVNGVTGRLVPPSDPEALASALVELLTDPDLAARQGNAGAQRVRERFNWPFVARIIAEQMGLGSLASRA